MTSVHNEGLKIKLVSADNSQHGTRFNFADSNSELEKKNNTDIDSKNKGSLTMDN